MDNIEYFYFYKIPVWKESIVGFLDLRRLRYFHAIGQAGSMSEAARHLGIAQPALSYHIREIEKDYGGELFRRSRQGMQLNDAGRLLLDHAVVILAQVERAEQELLEFGKRKAGMPQVVRLAAIPSLATLLTPRLLAEMRSLYPTYGLYVLESNTRESRSLLERGEVDLAVTIADETVAEACHLVREELFLAMFSEHPDRNSNPIAFQDVLKEQLILPSRGRPVRNLVEHHAAVLKLPVFVAYEIDGLNPRKQATISNLGRTLMPWISISDEIAAGTLRARRIVAPSIDRAIALERRDDLAPELGNVLHQALKRILKEMIPGIGAHQELLWGR
ncbi:LysR family transcriptional regulator [Microvirga sp. P5_D2]